MTASNELTEEGRGGVKHAPHTAGDTYHRQQQDPTLEHKRDDQTRYSTGCAHVPDTCILFLNDDPFPCVFLERPACLLDIISMSTSLRFPPSVLLADFPNLTVHVYTMLGIFLSGQFVPCLTYPTALPAALPPPSLSLRVILMYSFTRSSHPRTKATVSTCQANSKSFKTPSKNSCSAAPTRWR